MTDNTLHRVDDPNEMVCDHCGGQFHYDHRRHCWQCDTLTCSHCSSADNVCVECRTRVLPENLEPMLAKTIKRLPSTGDWAYEFKWDGIRALTYWDGRQLRIESRNQNNMTFRYPELHGLAGCLPENTIVDGEIIALDNQNRPSFSLLQKRMHISPHIARRILPAMRIFYYLFDLLYLNGQNLMDQPYHQRRQTLETLNIPHDCCRVPPSRREDPNHMLSVVKQFQLEGLIAKKLNSVYTPGRRSNEWVKLKLIQSREFLIGGFTYEQNRTDRIGSLQLGAYDNDMQLRYVGSAGTGFSAEDHRFLLERLEPLVTEQSSFVDATEKNTHFTQPLLIAQIEYRRWPKNGLIHQSAYKGLRTDKFPSEIKRKES